ncbi:Hypothetical protein SMAX5B_001921 [Scophthalmus maximus]|uniref:Uncharacterized protein n=1 Tax=Scophthalmus maximus TaxID=52904 RepID=A0A2U9CXW1_SCOMX|nr:Hypothetical protein SMAX5B_001921 [Scophthalmus maximus]
MLHDRVMMSCASDVRVPNDDPRGTGPEYVAFALNFHTLPGNRKLESAVRRHKVSPVGRSVGCGLQLQHQMPPGNYRKDTLGL